MWESLKAQLLEVGTAQLTGADASEYESKSTAGPGAGGRGSVFFSYEGHRVRLNVADDSPPTGTLRSLVNSKNREATVRVRHTLPSAGPVYITANTVRYRQMLPQQNRWMRLYPSSRMQMTFMQSP